MVVPPTPGPAAHLLAHATRDSNATMLARQMPVATHLAHVPVDRRRRWHRTVTLAAE